MKNKMLTRCPLTNEKLIVKKLYSKSADITIEGEFELSKYNYIDDELLYFMEVFIKNRGNIKSVEKELNISYPSVKKMLDDLILSLGYKLEEEQKEEVNRIDILKKVEMGLMTIDEALKILDRIGEK